MTAGTPGSVIKFTFTSTASTAQVLRAVATTACFISVKTTAAVHLCFGDSGLGAPTNSEFLLEPSDGWQDLYLVPGDTNFRCKGDSAGGDVYVAFLGN